MKVYVESNFVLELAFLQEQSSSCEEILSLAEGRRVRLVLPAYSLIEPYETLFRRERKRRRIQRELNAEIDQIARNEKKKSQLQVFKDITALLLRAVEGDTKRLNLVRSRLLKSAWVIPMDASVLRVAEQYERELKMKLQDAHIYSAVLDSLKKSEDRINCFLNRDRKDFDEPEIVDELKKHGCKLLSSFDQGRDYILSKIR